jgi:hypothetical protein
VIGEIDDEHGGARGAAHTWVTAHHEGLALAEPDRLDQPV